MGAAIPGVTGLLHQPTGQVIDGSLTFDSGKKNYLTRTPVTAGNSKTFTFSTWTKGLGNATYFCNGVAGTGDNGLYIMITAGSLYVGTWTTSWQWYVDTNRLFRDDGWYHLVVSVDTTQSTASDRVKLYVNGVQETSFANAGYPSQNYDTLVNNTAAHAIGRQGELDSHYLNKKLSQFYWIDGQQLGPENFGFTDPLTNTWRPKKYTRGVFEELDKFNTYTWGEPQNQLRYQGIKFPSSAGGTVAWKATGSSNTGLNLYTSTDNSTWTRRLTNQTVDSTNGLVYESSDQYVILVNDTDTNWSNQLQLFSDVNGATIHYSNATYPGNGSPTMSWSGPGYTDGTIASYNSFYLPFDGNSPIGQDKSGIVTLNNGSIWSDSLESSSGFRSSEPKTNAFDGNTSSICSAVGSGTITFTSPVTFASNSTIRVFLHGGDHTVTVNGGSDQTISAGSFQTVTYSNSGNPTFVMTFYRGGGADTGVRAIEIDGVILTDNVKGNSWTPVNFGNSNSLEKATGALPILNTTQGGTQATVGVRTDPHAANLVLALPLVGTSSDVSHQINGGSTQKVITDNGPTASSASSNFYNGSFYWNGGTTNRLTVTYNSEIQFGTGDFCIEFWVNLSTSSGNQYFFDFDQNGGVLQYNGNVLSYSDGYVAGSGPLYSTGVTLPIDKWVHLAVTREGSTGRIFVDGVMRAIGTTTYNYNQTSVLDIGNGYNNSGYEITGYMQDFRMYKGVAKYTSDFIVPATSPNILPETPSSVSGGSKLNKITDGAVSFNGSDEYLSIVDNADFTVGSNPFTIEFYAYKTESGEDFFCGSSNSSGANTSASYAIQTGGGSPSNSLRAIIGDGSSTLTVVNSGVDFPTDRWVHVAFVRDGNTLRLFQDGVQMSTTSFSGTVNDSDEPFMIGRGFGANSTKNFPGFISNFRFVKGTALYTSNFTPPSAPLTNVTNTKLLCCQSNTSATAAAIIPAGTPILEPFSGAGGAQGGGTTSDYLSVSSSGHSDFSLDGDFTVEWWHYRAATNVNNGFMWTIGDSKTSTGIELYWGTSGTRLNLYTNDGSNLTSATAATGWHHYAVVRNGTGSANITVYYDGTSVGTISNNTTFSGNVTIGGEFYNGTIYGGMNGPMSQFRLVKGTAVYTSNFTAPTTALTAITNTKLLTLQGSTPFTDNSGTSKTITVNGNIFTEIGGIITANGDAAATNFNPFNTDINTVRGQETGYATWNPLFNNTQTGGNGPLSDGNLHITKTTHGVNLGNFEMTSGKWYFELSCGAGNMNLGVMGSDVTPNSYSYSWDKAFGIYPFNPNYVVAGSFTGTPNTGAIQANSAPALYGVAVDVDNKKLWIHKDGIWTNNNPYTGTADVTLSDSPGFFAWYHSAATTQNNDCDANFGQKPFKFPPPDGFQPLNGTNLIPENVIVRPDQFVGISTWTGDSTDNRQIKTGFRPDLVWTKRTDSALDHIMWDSVRGVSSELYSNQSYEAGVTSNKFGEFNDLGFTIKNNSAINQTGDWVSWNWKAGGNKGTFNKDNVGHASASDVGMNVGGQNSNYYDSSQTWSNFLSSPQGAYGGSGTTNAFNGDLSSKFESGNPVNSHSTIRFAPSTPIKVNKGIRIYAFDYSDGQVSYEYRVNDTGSFTTITYSSGGSPYHRWIDLNFVGDLSSFEYRSNTSVTYKPSLLAVEIDGRQLLDSGVTPTDNYPTIPATGCSVGTKQGFSITKYTGNDQVGASIPHGLLETPKFVVIKNITNAYGWATLHTDVGFTGSYINGSPEYYMLYLNGTAGRDDWSQDTIWDPTPSYVRIDASGGANWVNNSNSSYIMYAWHDVPGLQKFGVYTGNGSTTSGAVINTGFKPSLVWVKRRDSGSAYSSWAIYDSTRSKFNTTGTSAHNFPLWINRDAQEGKRGNGTDDASGAENIMNLFSDGFMALGAGAELNVANEQYIYCAWAEAPTFNLYGGQANAR